MKITILLLVVTFLMMALLYGRPIIVGDGISYYALAVSLLEDHDFDLTNQRRQIHDVMTPFNSNTGKPASLYSCGFALLYAPFLYLTQSAANTFPALLEWRPYLQNTRFPFPDALGIFLASILFGFLTCLVTYFLLVYGLKQKVWNGFFTTLVSFVGSSLVFYTFAMPSYSHTADAFLTTVIFTFVFLKSPSTSWKVRLRNICLGLALALSISLRNNNIVLVLPAVGAVLFMERHQGWQRKLMILCEIMAGALPVVVIQIQFNIFQYGSILATGYKIQTGQSFLLEMLFHPWAGVFVWAPVTFFGLIGLISGALRRDFSSIVSLVTVTLVLFSVSFQGNWWGGCSFGQRFLTHLHIFSAIGISHFTSRLKTTGFLLSGVAALWTFFLFHIFYVNASSIEFKKILDQNNCRRTPVEAIQRAFRDYKESGIVNPVSFWLNAASSGPYPTLQFVLRSEPKNR